MEAQEEVQKTVEMGTYHWGIILRFNHEITEQFFYEMASLTGPKSRYTENTMYLDARGEYQLWNIRGKLRVKNYEITEAN